MIRCESEDGNIIFYEWVLSKVTKYLCTVDVLRHGLVWALVLEIEGNSGEHSECNAECTKE